MEDYIFIIFFIFTSTTTMLLYYIMSEKLDKLQKEIEWLRKRLS